jgi:pyruvate,water dikinase
VSARRVGIEEACSVECTPLQAVESETDFGGKAVRLAADLRSGLPVPPGFALDVDQVERVVAGSPGDAAAVRSAVDALGAVGALGGRVAVRSSAVGEDGAGTSFAGQHATVLGVAGADAVVAAIATVWRSGRGDAALAYRRKLRIAGPPRIAVVIQALVDADCAGVLFTVDPMTGADERVIEAAWGLGEAVVAGLVTPDHFRVRRDGTVLERTIGDKQLAIRSAPGGGTVEVAVPAALAHTACLDDAALHQLNQLAARCEAGARAPVDLEWAFAGSHLYLLQRRDVTRHR